MAKQILIIIGIIAAGALGYLFLFDKNAAAKTILYFGDTCPHCENVEKYIKDNSIDNKIEIERKEVYRNQGNAREMAKKAEQCGLPTGQIGVPFLWDNNQCILGDQPIIEYLGKK
jgi:glutaredoxin